MLQCLQAAQQRGRLCKAGRRGVSHATSSSSVGVIDVQHSDDNDESGWDERRLNSHAIDMTPQKEMEFTPQKTYGR